MPYMVSNEDISPVLYDSYILFNFYEYNAKYGSKYGSILQTINQANLAQDFFKKFPGNWVSW